MTSATLTRSGSRGKDRFLSRLLCALERTWLGCLRRVFRFGPWHVSAAYSCRPYKRVVVQLVNALHPATVIEIGCGLGDILGRVDAADRVGLDNDPAVIRAARFLHPEARWVHGDAACVQRLFPTQRQIDCLIMVNWTHNLSPSQLAECIVPLLDRTRYLVLDAIDGDAPASYRFRHDFAFLSSRAERLSVTRVMGEPRTFVVFEVTT